MSSNTEIGRLRANMLGEYQYLPDGHPAAGGKAKKEYEQRESRKHEMKEHEHPYWSKGK